MKLFSKKKLHEDAIEISLSEFISVTGGVIAGIFLLDLLQNVDLLFGLLILYPGLLEMNGNIYSSLAARLSNLLLLEKIKTKHDLKDFILKNIFAVFFLSLVVSLILGLIVYFFVYFVLHTNNLSLVYTAVLSSLFCTIIQFPLTIYTTMLVYKHKLDPENIMGPDITTISDIISVVSLIIAIKVL